MTIKHNQQIQHNHFRKDWQRRVRVHFDQPGRKQRRRQARLSKAAAIAPRPVDKLRPIVRCPTIKYNRRVRAGRGFTLAELKEAGIPRKLAPTIGISVDSRRQNLSTQSLVVNVKRLKEFHSRVILFPRRAGQHKNSDATAEEIKAAKETIRSTGLALPIKNVITKEDAFSEVKISEMGAGHEGAYRQLRVARSDARLVGVREKRAKAKSDEATAAKK
ncbi:MAG: 60S ribosomal protein L13 [Trizodia sp. TS-e1964]|nr:MAG: 60S ribosomal protein L13 [Trizodia sp. TS-e1964]